MVQILPEIPSFGQSMGRALGAGLGKGISSGADAYTERQNEKYKAQKMQEVVQNVEGKGRMTPLGGGSKATPQPSPAEMAMEFSEGIQELEKAAGKKFSPVEVGSFWEKFMAGKGQENASKDQAEEEAKSALLDRQAQEYAIRGPQYKTLSENKAKQAESSRKEESKIREEQRAEERVRGEEESRQTALGEVVGELRALIPYTGSTKIPFTKSFAGESLNREAVEKRAEFDTKLVDLMSYLRDLDTKGQLPQGLFEKLSEKLPSPELSERENTGRLNAIESSINKHSKYYKRGGEKGKEKKGKALSEDTAGFYLEKAGGDPDTARSMAREDGYDF